jgi:hypothetical protein
MAKKNYSVQWENDEAVAFQINGVRYKNLAEIPNEKDRLKMMSIMAAAEAADFAEPDSSHKMENIVLGIFAGVAALMLFIAALSAGSAMLTMLNEKSAPGQVVEVVTRREYINQQDRIIEEWYYPVVRFTAEDGRRRDVQMSVGSTSPEYEKGDGVTVDYNPAHPLEARIQSFGSTAMLWILPGITGILGLAFLGAVFIVRQLMPPAKTGAEAV